jgi:hypothetical protein
MIHKSTEILHLTIHSGRMINSILMIKDILCTFFIYHRPDTDKYADQQHVFEQVGLEILANAWEGYHCCLFAYGQTGAGKSYSMVGYGANKGIVPISCE